MVETGMMGTRVIDALVKTGVVTSDQIQTAEGEAVAAGVPVGRLLIEQGVVSVGDVGTALEHELGVPRVDLSSYAPDEAALSLIPAETARARSVLPLFEIDNMLTVAIGEPADVFELDILAGELDMEIEAVLVEPASLRHVIESLFGPAEVEEPASATPPPITVQEEPELPTTTGPIMGEEVTDLLATDPLEPADLIAEVMEAAPAPDVSGIDLDVLAVADVGKAAVLVSDILTDAVRKGASGIHLLPYKDDFFLVYRIGGRLEKVASAPLSLQAALVDGVKAYARLGAVPGTVPAIGRLKSRIADRELVLTVSVVPTVSGQRLVISLAADPGPPHDLERLGVPEAERRALHAMVERGRGMLLVCAPVAGGRSATYYALLAHAAAAGKTVYSVERSVEYEIPAVAQVLVTPGSPVGAAAYFAAGMRQDTDVMAIDSLQTVEDIHLAIEAAGLGKLVIATFSGGGIVAGVHRMLDMGVEPASLAAALTFGVGQRLVRTTCPNCAQDERNPIVTELPGAAPGLVSRAGMGCSKCAMSGFSGVTGLFEALPFAESVRAAIADGVDAGQLAEKAQAAGMRPLLAAGLARLEEGVVSAAELDRVLRFAQ